MSVNCFLKHHCQFHLLILFELKARNATPYIPVSTKEYEHSERERDKFVALEQSSHLIIFYNFVSYIFLWRFLILKLSIPTSDRFNVFAIPDSISIDQPIAHTFKLRVYKDVVVNKVNPQVLINSTPHFFPLPIFRVWPRITAHPIPKVK